MAAPPVFRPKGRELVEHYLVPKALGGYVNEGFVAEGVDVFSAATPDHLFFSRKHWWDNGKVWCYFFGDHPAAEGAPVPALGGRWFPYGGEKAYSGANGVGEAIAFRRRFGYQAMSDGGGDGSVVWAPTTWLMTEFRLNKGAAAFHGAQPESKVNMDCVVRKVFFKPAVQQGGSSRPRRSVATPVAPTPHAQVTATPIAPPPPAQVTAKPVGSSPTPACDEATSSRAQPDSPNANMEPMVWRRVPAKPVIVPTPPAQSAGARLRPAPMVVTHYLGPKALYGQLPTSVTPGLVAEGVDVFAVSPDALPFVAEVWGYFFAPKPTTSTRLAHGGRWMQYGREKRYVMENGEVIIFRRSFAFQSARVDGDGMVAWQQTRWLMKEYRMNKAAPFVRKAEEEKCPGANTDLVVLKVFTEPMVPLPPAPPPPAPAWFSYDSVSQGAGRSIAGGPSATATCLSPLQV
ncbi:hypothetical protein ACQ4PT_024809 [Festuca glaucescens]